MRIERDMLGAHSVPEDAFYGVHRRGRWKTSRSPVGPSILRSCARW